MNRICVLQSYSREPLMQVPDWDEVVIQGCDEMRSRDLERRT